MPDVAVQETMQTVEVLREEFIAAPIELVFETLLEQIGPLNEKPDGEPFPLKLEAWPGGRWYRDLGNNAGHYWGHVQAIKPPTLLEICGPLFMSMPAVSNVQYRLTSEGSGTRLKFSHRAAGWLPENIRDGLEVGKGWTSILSRIRDVSERKQRKETGK
jgi:uncharacterized protein YndB with AHSA1/START domain